MARSLANIVWWLKPRRRWAQFSLGTMLLAVTVLCVWLADYVSPIRKLERQLRDPDEEVRERAAERLGYLGCEARSAARSLVRATEDTSAPVRVRAVWALSRVAGRTDVLTSLLNDSDKNVAIAAAEGLLWNAEDPTVVVPRLLALGFPSDVGAIFAAMSPEQAAVAVPLLLDSLPAADAAALRQLGDPAATALRHVAMPASTVVPVLIQRLDNERPNVRVAAAEQLLRLGEDASQAAPALRARLQDPDAAVVLACAAALGAVEPSDGEFLPVLKRSLHSEDFGVALQAALYCRAMGPAAAGAADDLVDFFLGSIRSAAWPFPVADALISIGPPTISALDRALQRAMIERDQFPLTLPAILERVRNIAWVPFLRCSALDNVCAA